MRSDNYIYIYLDNRKPGRWEYDGTVFDFQPFYVGIGVGDRMIQHLYPYSLRQRTIKNRIIKKIIKKCGVKPIHFKLYENVTEERADELETSIIKHFGRINIKTGILANLTDGGKNGAKGIAITEKTREIYRQRLRGSKSPQSISVAQLDSDRKEIAIWSSMGEASRQTGIHHFRISDSCRTGKPTKDGSFWEKRGSLYIEPAPLPIKTTAKEVFQYLNGIFVQSFPSTSEAARILGFHNSGISVAANKQNLYKGYQWSYIYLDSITMPDPRRAYNVQEIASFDSSMNLIQIYSSIDKAIKETGIHQIKSALINGRLLNNQYWRYTQKNNVPISPKEWRKKNAPTAPKPKKQIKRKVRKLDESGLLISVFDSLEDAQQDAGFQLSYSIKNGNTRNGFRWEYEDPNQQRNYRRKIIGQDENGEILRKFDTVSEAVLEFPGIKRPLANDTIYKGLFWKYV